MADNSVFVAGIADGAFKQALDGVPPWATQITAEKIESWLRKSYGKQSELLSQAIKCCAKKSTGEGPGSAEAKKVADEMGKLGRSLKNQNEEAAKGLKRSKAQGKEDELGLGRNKKVQAVLAGITAAGTKSLDVMSDYIDVYDSLYKSGINVLNGNDSTTDGFKALNQTVLLTGLRLADLKAVAEKYSTSVNAVGFNKFAKTVALSTTALNSLGFSSAEGAELIGALVEAESGFSDIRRKSAEQLSADAIKTAAQFDKLSKTMGVTRQQMLDNLKTTAKSSESTLVAAKWGEKAALNVASALSGVKNDALKDTLLKMASAADPIFTQAYKDLQASGQGVLADQLATIAKSLRTVDPTEIPAILEKLGKNISNSGISSLADQAAGGNASAGASLDLITAIKQQSFAISQATANQDAAAKNTEAAIASFQTQTVKLQAAVEAAIYPTVDQLNILTGALGLFNDALYSAIGKINDSVGNLVGVTLAALSIAIAGITTAIGVFGGSGLTAAVGSFSGSLASIGLVALRVATGLTAIIAVAAGLDALAGKIFGIGDKKIDKTQDDANWDRMSALQKAESGFARGLEKLGSTLFLGNVANEASAARIRDETEYFNKIDGKTKSKETPISVPTTPALSAIKSPTAVEAVKAQNEGKAVSVPGTVLSGDGSPAIPKPGANADINNLLNYQGSVLERILLSTNELVSVNKDILRYARIQS